jgi:uncharacterized protein
MARETAPKNPPARAWQRMLSGRRLDLLNPSPLDIEIADIAHGLARVARWNGQTKGPNIFSVAQHSLLVEAFAIAINPDLSARWRMMVLLHDAPEYVIGDIISPFKAVLGHSYKDIENNILSAIHLRFSLPAAQPAPLAKLAKQADRAAAFIEATHLADFAFEEAEKFFGLPCVRLAALDSYLAPLTSDEAEAQFLVRFNQLEEDISA